MAKDPFEQFAIPEEMRAFAEQSVAQAKKAFDGFLAAANTTLGQLQGRAQAAQSSASDIAHKSLSYAEQNVSATFEFAQRLLHAKDSAEVMALQSEYVQKQMQTLSSQAQDLGQSAAKVLAEAGKVKG